MNPCWLGTHIFPISPEDPPPSSSFLLLLLLFPVTTTHANKQTSLDISSSLSFYIQNGETACLPAHAFPLPFFLGGRGVKFLYYKCNFFALRLVSIQGEIHEMNLSCLQEHPKEAPGGNGMEGFFFPPPNILYAGSEGRVARRVPIFLLGQQEICCKKTSTCVVHFFKKVCG